MTRAAPDPTGIVVLDGGMSNALEALGHDISGELWTARLLRDAPEAIADVHRTYFRAGADVATTASYQASVPGFCSLGMGVREAESLIRHSVLLAREVRDDLSADGGVRFVAASVGPYGAVLADGSEYRGRYGLTATELRDFHGPRLELLASAEPDLLAVETIPDLVEAEVLVTLLDEIDVPAWFSFSVAGGRTRAGQPLEEAFGVASSASTVVAVGVNCCAPSDVLDALHRARAVTGRSLIAYPNSGEVWDASARAWRGGSAYDVQLARQWVDAGVSYVGGCCRVGPGQIESLARAVR
jgi:homocysteine S-methyltransferase